ncbi:uncharacterized protein [Centruroides vittatus]|uniref:uncharacterized protein n=1 Tax=Centruroides vittatus TaxID=120091 RepID=UPI00350EDB43
MVYGTHLRLPGEFFALESCSVIDPTSFVGQLRETMRNLRPVATTAHSKRAVFVHKELSTCSHVFIRRDTIRKPLQPIYDGPYEVISRQGTVYKVRIDGRTSSIHVDRLKPAFTPSSEVGADSDIPAPITPSHTPVQPVPTDTSTPTKDAAPTTTIRS